MLGVIRRLFSGKDVSTVRQEINFYEAIQAHIAWKARLQAQLTGESQEALDPGTICLDNRCVLGQWIHGAGGRRFGHLHEFSNLRDKHAFFHFNAATVVRLHQAGEKEAADTLLRGDYSQVSREVVDLLREFDEALG